MGDLEIPLNTHGSLSDGRSGASRNDMRFGRGCQFIVEEIGGQPQPRPGAWTGRVYPMGDRGPAATEALVAWARVPRSLSDGRSGASRNDGLALGCSRRSRVYPMGDRGPAATRPSRLRLRGYSLSWRDRGPPQQCCQRQFIRWEIGGQPQRSSDRRRARVYPMGDRGPAATSGSVVVDASLSDGRSGASRNVTNA